VFRNARVLIAVAAVLAAVPSTASAWAPADSATIHPGVQTFTEGGQCTANFIYTAGGNTYIGQAAHCASTGAATDTDGCLASSLPLGTQVEITGASRPGTLAYSSWVTMQANNESNADACAYNDLALVRIDPADVGKVNPSVPGFGGPTGVGGEERRIEGDVPDVSARDVEPRQPLRLETLGWCRVGERPTPDLRACRLVRKRERDGEADPAQERRVETLLEVGGQDRQAPVRLHPLEEVANLDVGVTVVAVLHLAALAEQGIGLVEQQDGPAVLGGVEHPPQVLLRLADVLADDLAQVDPVQVEPEVVGEDLRSERLAGPASADEQGRDPQAAGAGGTEPPRVIDHGPIADLDRELTERQQVALRQHEICPACAGVDSLGEVVHSRPRLRPAGIP